MSLDSVGLGGGEGVVGALGGDVGGAGVAVRGESVGFESDVVFRAVGRGLRSVSPLLPLPEGVEELDVSHNGLESVGALVEAGLGSLRVLKASHNALRSLPRLGDVSAELEEVDVSWNALDDALQLIALGSASSLRRVDVRGNPLCERLQAHGVDLCVFFAFMFPHLESCNGSACGDQAQQAAQETFCGPDKSIDKALLHVLDSGRGSDIEAYLVRKCGNGAATKEGPRKVDAAERDVSRGAKAGGPIRVGVLAEHIGELDGRLRRAERYIRAWARKEKGIRERSAVRLQRWMRRGFRYPPIPSPSRTARLHPPLPPLPPPPFLHPASLAHFPPRVMTLRPPPVGTRARVRVAASVRVQAWWRGVRTRRHVAKVVLFDAAAVPIQAMCRGVLQRRQLRRNPLLEPLTAHARRLKSLEQRMHDAERAIKARDEALRVMWTELRKLAATAE